MKSAIIFIFFVFLPAFALQVSAQENSFPNELEGYKFFGEGKLKGLKLGVSTKKDVANIFGSSCERHCDYDSEWKIEFWYFDEKAFIHTYKQAENGEKIDEKYYIPKQEVMGTIREITIIPKNQVSFLQIKFSDKFECDTSSMNGQNSSDEWVSITYDSFKDADGLTYSFWSDDEYPKIELDGQKRQKGDLIQIEYVMPEEILKKMFIEKQK